MLPHQHANYRPDIDGLRAVAVLLVITFHAFPSSLPGGFVGVDIFFVISGFLISGIILQGLRKERFSFLNFYGRRVKRIFPALITVLVATYIAGWRILLPEEFKQLGEHIAGGATFISNILLWREYGYFDNAADTKPLLHLWSLGIEEQFYILWPPILWLSHRIGIRATAVAAVLMIVSFSLNVANVISDPTGTFYLPQTRFWELLFGCLLATLMNAWQRRTASGAARAAAPPAHLLGRLVSAEGPSVETRNILSLLGISLLALAPALVSPARAFPGWWALLPTISAGCLILAGPDAWLNRWLLANRGLVSIGLVSYPLYLWHWPLLSLARIVEYQTPSAEIRALMLLVALILATLTYHLIEYPIRFGHHIRKAPASLATLLAMVGIGGFVTYSYDGFGFRLADRSEFAEYFVNSRPEMKYFDKIDIYTNFRDECDFFDFEMYRYDKQTNVPRRNIATNCYQRDARIPNALFIWGDSHAQQLFSGLRDVLPASWQILQVASSGCFPEFGHRGPSTTNWCEHSNWFAVNAIRQARPDVVLIAQNSGHDVQSMQHLYDQLMQLGIPRVIFVGPSPHWTTDLPSLIARRLWVNTPRRTFIGVDHDVLNINQRLRSQLPTTESRIYADLIDVFCNPEGCLTYFGDDRKTGITSWDYGHLTPVASRHAATQLLARLVTGNPITATVPGVGH